MRIERVAGLTCYKEQKLKTLPYIICDKPYLEPRASTQAELSYCFSCYSEVELTIIEIPSLEFKGIL